MALAGVDEHAVLGAATASAGAAELVLLLARAKAEQVAAHQRGEELIVLGCDSMLEIDGELVGKPGDAATAISRWRSMRGRSGHLHTGHWLVPALTPGAATGATSTTTVHFADLSDAEVEAYVATGEPLQVAGAFTIDGLGGSFITGVDGDPHGVTGLSLPLLRQLLGDLGIEITKLWRATE